MLWTVFIALIVLWFLGIVSSNTFGGYLHILLISAVLVVLIRIIAGKSN